MSQVSILNRCSITIVINVKVCKGLQKTFKIMPVFKGLSKSESKDKGKKTVS